MHEMELTVKPVASEDAGEGVAVLGAKTARELGVADGDPVVVRGDGVAAARVRVGGDRTSAGDARVDSSLRRSVDAGVGETVTVEAVDPSAAERVSLAIAGQSREEALALRDELLGQVVVASQRITLSPGSPGVSERGHTADSHHRMPVRVLDTAPPGPVRVTEGTRISVDPEREEGSVDPGQDSGPAGPTYDDIGGLAEELDRVRETVEIPLRNPNLFGRLGVDAPTGVLIHGPPGTGKSLLATAVANETDAHFRSLSGTEIISKHFEDGHDDLGLADLPEDEPAVVFIEDLDSVAGGREGGEIQRWAVAQLLSLLEDVDGHGPRVVLGETSNIEDVDPALRRAGRFDREIELGVPDQQGREEILRIHARDVPLAEDVDLAAVAAKTHGFVGADLANLVTESAMQALRRRADEHDLEDPDLDSTVTLTADDFSAALRGTEPSALREVFVEVPDVSWDDVGGLEAATRQLKETIEWPLTYPEAFERVRLDPAKGVLLYGPPGTGKTLLAKAVANEAESNFISVKGPELLDKYVGESEQGVRDVFAKARENAPTVVFFDEIDALAGERGGGAADAGVGERVVSQLLTELDGLEALEDVVVVATTNRPELVDDALLRPGRFDRHVHVGAPDENGRGEIFAIHTAGRPLGPNVDLDDLAARTEGYVGADIESVCREAAAAAVRSFVDTGGEVGDIVVTAEHFEAALVDVETRGSGGGPGSGGPDTGVPGGTADGDRSG
jgi:transitional endoplasmic reticulum ATPase